MDLGISGRTALVTGAGRGMGRAIALRLAHEGATVAAVSRTADALKAVQARLAESGTRHVVLPLDLMTEGAPAAAVDWVLRELGPPDIIVHNLGGSLRVTDPLAPWASWEQVMRFNLGVGVEINNLLLPRLVERGWGRVVHVSTNASLTFQAYPAYVSAKAALNAYVKTVGRAMARSNVVISAVLPGAIRVEGRHLAKIESEKGEAWAEYVRNHLPVARLGDEEEVAAAVLFLCSAGAAYCSGSLLTVDGGIM